MEVEILLYLLSVALFEGRILIGGILVTSSVRVQKWMVLPSYLPSKVVRVQREEKKRALMDPLSFFIQCMSINICNMIATTVLELRSNSRAPCIQEALDQADQDNNFSNGFKWSPSWSSNWPLLLYLPQHRTRYGTWRRFRPRVAVIMSIPSPITNMVLKKKHDRG